MLVLASCEKDGEKLYVSPLEDTDLIATKNNIVLQPEQSKQVVLSFAWTGQSLTVSNPDYSIPNILKTTFMVSASEDMSSAIETPEISNSKAYTAGELNILTKNLGLEAYVSHPVYFCVKYSLGDNVSPVLSNVVAVKINPYFIDMRYASLLDKDQAEMNKTFFSKDENGVYSGFAGVTGWSNYYLREGDGTIWGNLGESGKEFFISSAEDAWNMWYPGNNGCYYSIVDTKKAIWSALFIPSLTIEGDINAEMTFDRPNNRWVATFEAKGTPVTVKISGKGNQYNTLTACDDALAGENSVNVGFAGNSDNLEFVTDAQEITVPVSATGECSIILDLNAADNFKLYAEEGSSEPDEVKWAIWIGGLVDGFNEGAWTYDNFLRIDDEDTKTYVGVQAVNSNWGYKFYTESTWEADSYGTDAEGTADAGKLLADGGNIPAPVAGTYFMTASLSKMEYTLTKIYTVQCAGVNDDWTLRDMEEVEPGVFTISLDFTAPDAWGFKIILNGDWDYKFYGGFDGTLYRGSSINYDDSFVGTTKLLTVDFNKGLYFFN